MEERKNLQEIIDKFDNGDERYIESALFNLVVHDLHEGVDPIKIIDNLISSNDSVIKIFREYILKTPFPMPDLRKEEL